MKKYEKIDSCLDDAYYSLKLTDHKYTNKLPLYFKRRSIDGVKKLKKVSKSTLLILEEAEKNHIKWEKISYTGIFYAASHDT